MNYEFILENLLKKDDRFIIMTAENRAAIRSLPQKIGNRFIDVGIAEMTLIGMAAGLALRGRVPIVHSLATFLTMRAYEFIRTDVGLPSLSVKLVGGFPGILSEANGPTHQSLEDVSILRSIPNLKIFCPADNNDLLICLNTVMESSSPYYIRFNDRKPIYEHTKEFEEGKAEVISFGKDVNIFTYGFLFSEAYETTQLLLNEGYDVGLINLRTLKPVDEYIIIKSLKNSLLTVTIEDHFLVGGLFSIISEIASKNNLRGYILPIAFKEKWFKPALYKDVLEFELLNKENIRNTIINQLKQFE